MRTLSLVLSLAFTPALAAQEPQLTIGDKAPALAAEWIGEAPDTSDEGTVRTVVFWSPTSSASTLDLRSAQMRCHRPGSDGRQLILVASGSLPDGRAQELLRAYEIDAPCALDDRRDVYDSWVKAAGRDGLPQAFVIDRSNRIVWIGAPGDSLFDCVDQVSDGAWTAEYGQLWTTHRPRYQRSMRAGRYREADQLAAELIAANPANANAWLMRVRARVRAQLEGSRWPTARVAVRALRVHPQQLLAFIDRMPAEVRLDTKSLQLVADALPRPDTKPALRARFVVTAQLDQKQKAFEALDGLQRLGEYDARRLLDRVPESAPYHIHWGHLRVMANPRNVADLALDVLLHPHAAGTRRALAARIRAELSEKPRELGHLTWLLLDSEEAAVQEMALGFAVQVVAREETAGHLDTLAKARFVTGDVDGAIATQERAIRQAKQPNSLFELHLRDYRAARRAAKRAPR